MKKSNRHSDKFETLKLLDINFSVEGKEILKDVSLSFSAGEKLIILGPSGSGKSTLVEIICGLISPPNMQVLFNGKKVETINDALGAVKSHTLIKRVLCLQETCEVLSI